MREQLNLGVEVPLIRLAGDLGGRRCDTTGGLEVKRERQRGLVGHVLPVDRPRQQEVLAAVTQRVGARTHQKIDLSDQTATSRAAMRTCQTAACSSGETS